MKPTILMTSGYTDQTLNAVRQQWTLIDIENQLSALDYLRNCQEIPDVACVGNARKDPTEKSAVLDARTFMKEIHAIDPDMPVIISTSLTSPRTIVDLVKNGAFDYVVEPVNKKDSELITNYTQDLIFSLTRALQWRSILRENRRLKENLLRQSLPNFIQGRSRELLKVLESIRKVAPTPATVLITGESGTGKELAAKAIHTLSERKDKPFIAINCGALNENLLASELFGYVKGAFTGADTDRPGLIREAEGGTLFLDEIATVSQNFQVMLLRILEERKARPVGSARDYPVNCRFISAANRDLEAMVEKGEFREDLFYRLNVFHINIPPLRKRHEDIAILADFFLKQTSSLYAKDITGITPPAMDLLEKYHWPGNVRQLRNAIERAIISCENKSLAVNDFDSKIRNTIKSTAAQEPSNFSDYNLAMKEFETKLLRNALVKAKGNISQAARMVNMKRTTFTYRIKQLGVFIS